MRINKWNWKEFLIKAGIRAVRTFAQTAFAMITVGATLNEIDWGRMFSVAIVATIGSIFTSLATGLPEVDKTEGEDE